MIDLGTDAGGLKLRSVENGDGAGDVAGLLHRHEGVHEGLEDGGILEMNGDDAAAADQVEGRLDALDHGVGSSACDEGAGLAVFIGFSFHQAWWRRRTKNPCVSRT